MSHATVLVVEDEPLLRLHAVMLLEEAGYATLQAGSADEAIERLESTADIRAVFTDIDLPGDMDGLRLAASIRDRWPPVELILTSGHVKIEKGQLPERGHFLPKPYTSRQLMRALENLHIH
ncbi:response regulator [Reyranella sp.]|uniref:response regulator n=1 Tax=Reyranella sp. TaxID=1929291 RepID=UPI0025FDE89D|nr:response regulator [Reyranella sp.]